jgi:FdhD protein
MQPRTAKQKLEVTTCSREGPSRLRWDQVAVEEPLEIKLVGSDGRALSLATVLRTPGHDFELCAGFLFAEGLIEQRSDIREISFCQGKSAQSYQAVSVHLAGPLPPAAIERMRKVVTHSGCGACSMPSLPEAKSNLQSPAPVPGLTADWLHQLPGLLAASAPQFAATGGVHAASLCRPPDLKLEQLFEDVGRHNAVDKLVGQLLLKERFPLPPSVLLLSGRAGFELLQKAARAGLQAVVSLGAPTTLSVQWARRSNITLIGFLSERRFNVYHGHIKES